MGILSSSPYIHRSMHDLTLKKNIQGKKTVKSTLSITAQGHFTRQSFPWSALGKKYFVIFTGQTNPLRQSNEFYAHVAKSK